MIPYRIPDEAETLIRGIVREAHASGLIQRELDDPRAPIVTDRFIRFNGVDGMGHETFVYNLEETPMLTEDGYFSCCKTAQKPYDVIVMKVLIVLKYYLGDVFCLNSDGDLADWADTLDEMSEKYGISLDNWRPH